MKKLILLSCILLAFPAFSSAQVGTLFEPHPSNPVFQFSGTETFDKAQVRFPRVIKDGDTYFMYYMGLKDRNQTQIGLAISEDGVNWSRYSQEPIFRCGDNQLVVCESNTNWSSYRVSPIKVLNDGDEFKMWYLGDSYNFRSPNYVGLATSSDGINWNALSSNPLYPGVDDFRFDSLGIEKLNNQYLMYFTDGSRLGTKLITSSDGVIWEGVPVVISTSTVNILGVIQERLYAEIGKKLHVSDDGINFTDLDLPQMVDENVDNTSGTLFLEGDVLKLWKEESFSGGGVITYWTADAESVFLDEEKSLQELVAELEEVVEEEVSKRSNQNSYFAHIKKIVTFFEDINPKAAVNQVKSIIKKAFADENKGNISPETGSEIQDISEDILEIIELEGEQSLTPDVPLITQIASPFPPESVNWEDDLFGDGSPDWCGNTIGGCGCSLASMSMLAHSYGVSTDVEGNIVNPANMNAWLNNNQGYTPGNLPLWGKVLEYLGEKRGQRIVSNFVLTAHNETNQTVIDEFLNQAQPVVAFNSALGHYFVLSDKNENGGYNVRDPFWYNTETTDQVKDVANSIQGYNNDISKANLFTRQTNNELAGLIEIHLGSPAELRLRDESGDITGYVGGTIETEIDSSSYDQAEFIATGQTEADPHPEKVLIVSEPTDEQYTLEVLGTDEGEYDLTVYISNGTGYSVVNTYQGETSLGQVDVYEINLGDLDSGHGNETDGCDDDNRGGKPECRE